MRSVYLPTVYRYHPYYHSGTRTPTTNYCLTDLYIHWSNARWCLWGEFWWLLCSWRVEAEWRSRKRDDVMLLCRLKLLTSTFDVSHSKRSSILSVLSNKGVSYVGWYNNNQCQGNSLNVWKTWKVEPGDGGECYARRANAAFGEAVYNWHGGFWSS